MSSFLEDKDLELIFFGEKGGVGKTTSAAALQTSKQGRKTLIMSNRVTPPTKCSFCSSRMEREQEYVEEIHEKFFDYAISEMPLFPHEVRGMDGLTSFADVMYGGDM